MCLKIWLQYKSKHPVMVTNPSSALWLLWDIFVSESRWDYLVTQAPRPPPPPLLLLLLLSVLTQLETPQLPDLIMSYDLMSGAVSRTTLSEVWQDRFHTMHHRLMRSSPLSLWVCETKKENTPWLWQSNHNVTFIKIKIMAPIFIAN